MKPTLFVPIHQGVSPLPLGLRKRCKTLLALVVAAGLSSGAAFSQLTYYQVNPPGSGITGATFNEIAYVDSFLPANVSLYSPVPAGYTAATSAQLATAVAAATNGYFANTAPAGVSPASIATQIVANNPAAASSTLAALANSIMADQASGAAFITLNSVVSSLAAAYPSTISTLSAPIFTSAAANAGQVGNIAQLAVTATTAVSSNDQTVGAIVGQALTAVVGSSSSSKAALLEGIVAQQMGTSQINSSLASIQAIATQMTTSAVTAQVSLSAILTAAVNALPAGDLANTTQGNTSVGAIVTGALASQGGVVGGPAAISSAIASANSATQAYTNMIVNGYNNSSTTAAYTSFLAANPSSTDAIVAGGMAKGVLSPTVLITDALQSGTTVPVQNIVAAAVSANLGNSNSTSPAIAGAAIQAISSPSPANYLSVAEGAVGSARIADAGNIAYTLISDSSGYATNTLSANNVSYTVNGALIAAYANGRQGAIANIVTMSEMAAYNTTSTATTAVTQAIATMQTQDASNPDLPTYIAVAAGLAGWGGSVSGLPAIVTAAETQDSRPNAETAFNDAESIVASIRTTSTTGYYNSVLAFQFAAAQTTAAVDSAMAVLYAASLADPNDASALLAAAISKDSTLMGATAPQEATMDANLLAAAINSNLAKQANLTIASTVAVHIETNLLNNATNDVSNYVGYEVAQNPTYVRDIAAAAVAVDPNQANYVARAAAYNDPTGAYAAIPSIFAYSQITTKPNDTVSGTSHIGEPTNSSTAIDMTSAAAAIAAGYTIGILEAQGSPSMTGGATGTIATALGNGIQAAVLSAVIQSGVQLTGQILESSTGITTTGFTNKKSVGAAGVITGFVSQVVEPGDGTGANGGTSGALGNSTVSQAIIDAVLKAAVQNGGNTYVLQMAQAAGQAFGYISGITGSMVTANLSVAQITSVAAEIGADMYVTGGVTEANIQNAAYFGIMQGQEGNPGAGASGVSFGAGFTNAANYSQHNATGLPVTDIFNL